MAAETASAAGGFTKIKVENPVVDITGDEMTQIIWDVRCALRWLMHTCYVSVVKLSMEPCNQSLLTQCVLL